MKTRLTNRRLAGMFQAMNSTNFLSFIFVHVVAEHLVSPLSRLDGLRHGLYDDLVIKHRGLKHRGQAYTFDKSILI